MIETVVMMICAEFLILFRKFQSALPTVCLSIIPVSRHRRWPKTVFQYSKRQPALAHYWFCDAVGMQVSKDHTMFMHVHGKLARYSS
jgi:hypothetical protein